MVDDVELGRRLAALRVYRGMGQRDVAAKAVEYGIKRGLGATQLSLIETGRVRSGTDGRIVMVLCEIYGVEFKVLTDPAAKIFAATTEGLVEGLISKVNSLTEQLERLSSQFAAARVQRETGQRKEKHGLQEDAQSL